MFNLNPEKILLVLVIALVVLGPNRLPQAARTLGRLVANLRRLSGTLEAEVRDALAEPRQTLQGTVGDLGLGELRDSLREVANPLAPPRRTTTPPASPPADSPPSTVAELPPPPDDPSLN